MTLRKVGFKTDHRIVRVGNLCLELRDHDNTKTIATAKRLRNDQNHWVIRGGDVHKTAEGRFSAIKTLQEVANEVLGVRGSSTFIPHEARAEVWPPIES